MFHDDHLQGFNSIASLSRAKGVHTPDYGHPNPTHPGSSTRSPGQNNASPICRALHFPNVILGPPPPLTCVPYLHSYQFRRHSADRAHISLSPLPTYTNHLPSAIPTTQRNAATTRVKQHPQPKCPALSAVNLQLLLAQAQLPQRMRRPEEKSRSEDSGSWRMRGGFRDRGRARIRCDRGV